ncbi:MAG: sugar ABC transporter permease, partial [Chloroflexota bacterium]
MRITRTQTVSPKTSTTSLKRRSQITAYGFLSLQLVGLFVFVGGPLLVSLYYTFTHWDLIKPAPEFVGLKNWFFIFQDPRIAHVLWNTVRFILLGASSFLILSLFLALALNNSRSGTKLFRAIFFLPWVLSPVAVGIAWTWLLNTRSGP